jgi:negative regulator of flagellin synthesis FlgM
MKVSNKLPNPMQNAETAKAGKAAGPESLLDTKRTRASDATSAADFSDSSRVELSQRALDIKKARELSTPSASVDEAKVARLQAMIDAGKYKVDADAIADRLLDEHSKMPT